MLVLHDAWLYLLIAAGALLVLLLFCQFVLLGVVSDFWIRRVHKKKLPDQVLSPTEYPLAGMILLFMSL